MKKQILIFSVFSVLFGFAQSKPDCSQVYKEYELYYQYDFNEKSILTEEGRTKATAEIDDIIKKCPSQNPNIYSLAEDMLQRIIKPLNMGDEKKLYTRKLTEVYDKQSQHFPNTKDANAIKKVVISYNNGVLSDAETIAAFDKIYQTNKDAFTTDALNMYVYLVLSEAQVNNSNSTEFIRKADALNASLQQKIEQLKTQKTNPSDDVNKKLEGEISSLEVATRNISSSLRKAKITCDTWNKLYQDDFDKNKSDVAWLENALTRLETNRCMHKNELFVKMATRYYELKKTSKSSFYMGNLAFEKKNNKEAVKYFSESADLQTNKEDKAGLYYKIATILKGSAKAQAKLFAEKAIENNPEMIENYILLAGLYTSADKDCFKNEFEQKAVYLLAAQTAERIIAVNPKFEKSAKKLSESYLEKAPTQDEIKKSGMQGKTIQFDCWINESVLIN